MPSQPRRGTIRFGIQQWYGCDNYNPPVIEKGRSRRCRRRHLWRDLPTIRASTPELRPAVHLCQSGKTRQCRENDPKENADDLGRDTDETVNTDCKHSTK